MQPEAPFHDQRETRPTGWILRRGGGGFTEEQFYDLQSRMERMSGAELARFRAAPENQGVLREFDAFALQRALPYLCAMIALLLTSVAVALLLSA